jgi:nucleoside-diphosphate-sugar epimerase
LLAEGHHVRVLDCQWFGSYLERHERLKVVKGDIRDQTFPVGATDVVIHLAGVVLDAAGELDPKLTWEINALATTQLAERAARAGVQQFIYASSGSVYGVSDAPEVTEDEPLVPMSEYNKTKLVAERVVLSYAAQMGVVIFRPATVCGFSPRMRLDTMVNSFTMQALTKGVIRYNGGEQYRPNIHIDDMTDLYLWAVLRPGLRGILNAGFENLQIKEIAELVADRLAVKVIAARSTDARSYRINSDKLLAAGFSPKKTVSDAIDELIEKYNDGILKDDPLWHSLSAMPKAA